MKKTLSFEKDIAFQTMIGEVTTISLDDDLKLNDNSIVGNFYVSGKYKIYDASTMEEDFSYSIPVEVELVDSIDSDTSNISIDNFTYEIIDDNIMRCKIDVLFEYESECIRDCDSDIIPNDEKEMPIKVDRDEEEKEDLEVENKKTIKVNSLFSNMSDESDSYKTYSVYIMRQDDTIEKVMDKYKVSKEDLQNYNDLSSIELNSKIIIPVTSNNE